jgi:2-polyprenyl-3-methyl-5-hydroxy-6-metoxy-1,4-benzoquinol methylase
MNSRQEHWEKVYTKPEQEFSWHQAYPETSMRLIEETKVSLGDPIIDIGGGDSHLVDALLNKGYSNIHVLDISQQAINRARKRLGDNAAKVNWIISDIVDFKSSIKFSVWHDRATLHFLTDDDAVKQYRENLTRAVKQGGNFILGTFSINGPARCSGLPVRRYSEQMMETTFRDAFRKVRCFEEMHETPFRTEQLFQYCMFVKKTT